MNKHFKPPLFLLFFLFFLNNNTDSFCQVMPMVINNTHVDGVTAHLRVRSGTSTSATIISTLQDNVKLVADSVEIGDVASFYSTTQLTRYWYKVSIPDTGHTPMLAYVAAGVIYTNPVCSAPYFKVLATEIYVRNAIDTTSGAHITMYGGNAKVFQNQYYAIIDSGTDITGHTWYKISLPNICSDTVGWVSSFQSVPLVQLYHSGNDGLPPPENITSTGISSFGVDLIWDMKYFPYNTTFYVYSSGSLIDSVKNNISSQGTDTFKTLYSLACSTSYSINIRAANNGCLSDNAVTPYSFSTSGCGTGGAGPLVLYQYWFDNNYSSAITNTITTSATTFSYDGEISTSSLSSGFHTINIRVKDNTGLWSVVTNKYFYKNATTVANLISYQYWFDNDYSSAVTASISATSVFSYDDAISVSSLTSGFHTINIRSKDNGGHWSVVTNKYFYKNATTVSNIVNYQYWFDNDYSGAMTASVAATSVFSFDSAISVSALTSGFHTINIRSKDNGGHWSVVTNKYFYKNATTVSNIVNYQYWFDNDYSSAINTTIAATSVFSFDSAISVSALASGFHTINIRSKDNGGHWSVVTNKYFYKNATTVSNIINYQYWFDNNFSAAVTTTVSPTSILEINSLLSTSGIAPGFHTLNIRSMDNSNKWSVVTNKAFYINNTLNSNIAEYRYWFNSSFDSAHYVTFTTPVPIADVMFSIPCNYLPPGNDTVYFEAKNSSGIWSVVTIDTAFVTSHIPTDTITASSDTVCSGTPVTFTASSSLGGTSPLYIWIVNGIIVDTASTYTYNPVNGDVVRCKLISNYPCRNIDTAMSNSIAMVVNPLPNAGNITGIATVCVGSTTTLSDAASGGTWSSVSTGVATITSGGIVTGVLSGTSIISYTVTNSCGTVAATKIVTVNPLPIAGSIIGTATVCAGSTTSLSDIATGGTWSSVTTGVATINSSGVVTGVSAGTSIISYTVTNSCGTAVANATVTVNPLPIAGSITGTATVCSGSTTTLSDVASGGTWSSVSTGIATITSGGVVTGVSSGTSIISYTVTNSCGTVAATKIVTVNPLPISGSITGTATVCAGSTTSLSDAAIGGTWSSVTTGVATINSSGVVTGVSAGTSIISYTVTNSCGTAVANATVTVNPLPVAGSITGTATVCSGSTTTLSDVASGGTWSSLSTGIATITSGGVVTGVSSGTSIISYTVTNSCGTVAATKIVTVNPLPISGSITGTATVCAGSTTSLSDAATGGTWSSVTTGVATINSSGVVTGVSAGTSIISYTVTNSCGTAVANTIVTVNPLPIAGSITGTATVCAGSTTSLSDAATGGTWSSVTTGVATINSSGVVTGVSMGNSLISYTVINSCGTAVANTVVTVNPLPIAGSITGTATVCAGSTTTLSDAATGGTWSSVSTGVATITSGGVVTGVSAGTSIISYTVTNSCGTAVANITVTVNPLPIAGSITGTSTVCASSTTSLSDAASGGIWSSLTTGVATINSSGVVTGVSSGNSIISYTVTNSCGTAVANTVVTVNPLPIAGSITGTAIVCAGSTTTLSDAASGGTWSSVSTGVATITSGGVVTGVSAGTSLISYTVTNSCGTVVANATVTVNPLPIAGSITGTAIVCAGSTTTLSDAASGGTWSSVTTGVATINSSGVVTGVSSGTSIISYTVTNSCGTAVANITVTVNPLPIAGSITGTSTVCASSTTSLSDAASGGIWSSLTTGVATINSSGVVTGVSSGNSLISYTVTNSCGTAVANTVVTVNPLPIAGSITGTAIVCAGSTTTLSDAASGGTWSSVSTGVATITSGGVVIGVSPGTSLISYAVTNSCGTAVANATVTVNPLPIAGSITGTTVVCAGSTTTLSDAASGGTWSSVTTGVATITSGGVVTGVSSGTSIISYTVTNSCGTAVANTTVTVNPLPIAGSITGTSTVCAGSTTTLSDATTGGTWSSVSTGVATITSGGVVTGVSSGTSLISYTVTNSCGTAVANTTVTVNPLPIAGSITGTATVCAGSTTTLSDAASGGIWSSVTTGVATITSGGVVTGVSAGTSIISYTVTNSCGTAVANTTVTVNPLPIAGSITGTATVCAGSTTSLSDIATGGTWSTVSTGVATITSSGVVTGVSSGTSLISYTVTNSCGTAVANTIVTVNPLPIAGSITGTATVCAGSTTSLSDIATGGTWSSVITGVATITSGGVVTGISSGTSIISYTVTNSCGTAVANTTVTVNPLPIAGSITGTATVCAGSTTSLSDIATGGTWSSVSTGVATITSGGVVTGVSAGTSLISYTVTNSCGTAVANTIVTVNPLPIAGSITGTATVCAGSTTSLSDAATGGTWSSVTTGIATINSSGVVTGVSSGTSIISYTVTNSCGTAVANTTVTVNPLPIAGSITGTSTVCAGSTTSLSDAASGGTWSSVTTGVATINSSGVVTGVSSGISLISYTVTNSCGTAVANTTVIVNPLPIAGSITGTATVCAGSTTSLSDIATGGTWSSVTTGVATINSSGVVTGVSSGTSIISYTVTNSCGTAVANATVSVNPLPIAGSITGITTVCAGSTTTLSDVASGGTWSATNSNATVISGVILGVSTGIDTIIYSVSNSCGTAITTAIITIDSFPISGSITGIATVCAGSTTSLSDAATGGTWNSVSIGIATISSGGIVTGVSTGTSIISYTVTNSCGTAVANSIVTVNPLPIAGSITGIATVCVGSTTSLSDVASGGFWSSVSTAVATISSGGVVTGLSTGTSLISYTVTNGCGTAVANTTVTVNPLPIAGSITGTATVCEGSTSTLSDTSIGGTWSSVLTGIATITSGGVVTGGLAGTSIISYTVTNSCGTDVTTTIITVSPLPIAGSITGTASVCESSTTTLSDVATSGTWSSVSTGVVTISSGGVVTGVLAGTSIISYTVTNSCGTDVTTTIVTVNPLPIVESITGIATVCAGSITTLTDVATGGTWGATNSNATVTSGFVDGVSAGIDTIIYTVTNSCGTAVANTTVTVNPLPIAGSVMGAVTVCAGSTTTLSDIATGGTWSSVSTGVATITSGGLVTGISAGIDTISYSVSNSCGTAIAISTLTVNPLPIAGIITGIGTVCAGSTTTLSDTAIAGTWNSTSTGIATIISGGVVTGVSAGTSIISYTVTNGCGMAVSSFIVSVNPLPIADSIIGTATVCVGSTTSLNDSVIDGTWSSVSTGIATINSSGVVTGVSAGISLISYTFTNSCGTVVANIILTVNPLPIVDSIIGYSTICAGVTQTLNDSAIGGIWSSADTSIASVDSIMGILTGVHAGTSIISFTVTNSCGTATATKNTIVYPLPNAGIISGTDSVCIGSIITLTDTANSGSGLWISYDSLTATVSHGIVTGLTSGIDTIYYSVSNGCSTGSAHKIIFVKPLPNAGLITGLSMVCTGSIITLSDTVSSGIWSMSNTRATVTGGIVTGVYLGIDTLTYLVTNFCGSSSVTKTITVNPLPFAGTITGLDSVCAGAIITLSDTASGGIWSSNNTNAIVIGGIVTGINAGIDTINYSVSNSCGTSKASKIIVVKSLPIAGIIIGSDSVCIGSTITLTDASTGGLWSRSNTHAIVTGGIINGITNGIDTITYAVINSCGVASVTKTVTIIALPIAGIITGTDSVCIGANITLIDTSNGGIWSSSNSLATVLLGVVSGVNSGIDTIIYTVNNFCGIRTTTKMITIKPLPHSGIITGLDSVCVGSNIILNDTSSGGTWGRTNSKATITGGLVTGVTAGIDTIIYSVTNSCGMDKTEKIITIKPLPNAGIISGTDSLCVGTTTTLSDIIIGGVWNSSNTNASISGGIVTGISTGLDTINYRVNNSCGIDTAKFQVSIIAKPSPVITGLSYVCKGDFDTLFGSPIGGLWSSSNTHASIFSGSIIQGISSGIDTIFYRCTNFCGTGRDSVSITIFSKPQCDSINLVKTVSSNNDIFMNVFPNPSDGMFTLDFNVTGKNISIVVMDLTGKIIATKELIGNQEQKIPINIINVARGTYLLKVVMDERIFRDKLVIW